MHLDTQDLGLSGMSSDTDRDNCFILRGLKCLRPDTINLIYGMNVYNIKANLPPRHVVRFIKVANMY